MSADLTTLLRSTHLSHDEILKASNHALKKSKQDVTAQHARAIALLKLDRFADAVRAFDDAGQQLKDDARLAYAYALYKDGQLERAEEVAGKELGSGDGEGERGLRHVLAQTRYRLEKFGEARGLYETLGDGSAAATGEANDLRINGAAVDAQLEWAGEGHLVPAGKKQPAREDLDAFESAYNAACGAIARGELAKGEILLRRAQSLCLASEELSEEEQRAELVPIVSQMVYVLLRLGKSEEAKKVAKELDVEGADEATKWISKVNSLVADAEAGETPNAFLTHRIFNSGPALTGVDTPFTYQSALLAQDSVITDLLASKHAGVIRSTTASLSTSTSPTTSASTNGLSVLNAAAHAKGQSSKAGLKAVLPLLEQRPNDVGLLLTVLHLYCLTNNHGSAISLLESFLARLENSKSASDLDVRHAPGLIAVLVSLYSKQNRTAGAKAELARAASYWRSRRKEDSSIPLPISLLRAAGTALLEGAQEGSEDAQNAVEIFTDLHALNEDDRAASAGLIAALALASPEAEIPAALLKSLTLSARLTADLDAAALESAGIPSLAPSQPSARKRPATDATTTTTSNKKEKKTKLSAKRTPKDFVPGRENTDKERWLPLRDRSYWRPKGRKKGKGKGADLTQGGNVDESLGRTGESGGAGAGAGGKVVQAAGGGGKGKAGKKKKR